MWTSELLLKKILKDMCQASFFLQNSWTKNGRIYKTKMSNNSIANHSQKLQISLCDNITEVQRADLT